jgi:outer membrane receptor for ferrienterochelin and colicins
MIGTQCTGSPIDRLIVSPIVSTGLDAETVPKRWRARSISLRRFISPRLSAIFIAIILSLLSLLASPRVSAQNKPATPNVLDMSLEDLMTIEIDSVYGASGFKQKVTEAPASVTIITADDIQKHGYRTLAEILANVRGFYVSTDDNYSYVGVRGYGLPGDYNSRVALMIDGHRLNDDIFDAALIGTEFPIDVDMIDRVEIIRGPNSSQYVASAFLGVINVITKRGLDSPKVSIAGELGSYGTYEGRVSYGNKFDNGLEMLVSGTFYDSHGQDQLFFSAFNNPATNNGIAVNADGDEFHQLFANLSWGNFTLQGVFGSREKTIPTAPFGTIFDVTGTHTIDARGYLDLKYDRSLGRGWNLTNRIYYDQFNNDGTYIYDNSATGGPSSVMNRNFAHGKWWGDQITVSKKIHDAQRLSGGLEYRDNFQQDQGNFDIQPFHQYFSSNLSSNIFSLFAQDEIHIRKNLVLNVGLRYDHYSTFGGTTNPRAALIYNPWAKTTFKFLYGQSFRAPNFFELFYAAPGNEANPSLRPETVKTFEVVWEQYFANHFRMTVSGFYYPIHSLITEQLDPLTGNAVFENVGSLNLHGMDIELGRRLPAGLQGTISYSFQEVTNPSAVLPVTNSPKHLVQASLIVPLVKDKLFASMDLQYVSSRATLTGQYSAAYVVPNVTLFSRNLRKGWDISGSLYNIFNQKFSDPAGNGLAEDAIFQQGRNFRVKVGYRFQ